MSRNIIVDKTITKRKKAKDGKQETGNKEYIIKQSLEHAKRTNLKCFIVCTYDAGIQFRAAKI